MPTTDKPTDERLARLRQHLQWALEVEHFTIPPYLCALYSIPEGTNSVATSILQSVVMEEMLHMAQVANLLNAVGGSPQVIAPNYPAPLPHITLQFPQGADNTQSIPLQKFSREAIDVFMEIEKPAVGENPPASAAVHTIGEFYAAIRTELEDLLQGANKLQKDEVFSGNPAWQIGPEYYYGGAGKLLRVRNFEDAQLAIEEIVDQGEGLHGDVFEERLKQAVVFRKVSRRMQADDRFSYVHDCPRTQGDGQSIPAHYFRFKELSVGRYYQGADESDTPTGPVLPVQWDAVYNMRPSPKAIDYQPGTPIRQKIDEFNRCYTRFCQLLQNCFSGQPELMNKTPVGMFDIKHRSLELMRIADDPGQYSSLHAAAGAGGAPDQTVGPSFEYVVPQ